MKNIEEQYIDGVETIHLLNATVRMDMFTLQPPQEGEEKPSPHVSQRIIMPIQSFLTMHSAMQQIINKMLQDGIIKSDAQKNSWDVQ